MLILGILRLNLNVWMLGKIAMVENSNNMVILSQDPDVVPAPPTPESQFPAHPVRNPGSCSSRVNVVRFRDSFGRFLPRSASHQSAHHESENSPRMRSEPGSSSRDGQPIRVDAPDHAVIPGDVEMQGQEFEVGANDENPNFQRVPDPDQPSEGNPPC